MSYFLHVISEANVQTADIFDKVSQQKNTIHFAKQKVVFYDGASRIVSSYSAPVSEVVDANGVVQYVANGLEVGEVYTCNLDFAEVEIKGRAVVHKNLDWVKTSDRPDGFKSFSEPAKTLGKK